MCAFFQWHISLELALCLVEIIFILHMCMKMVKALGILIIWVKSQTWSILFLVSPFELVYLFFALPMLQALTSYMFSFSLGQGSIKHILVVFHVIMVGNYMKKRSDTWWKEWEKFPNVDYFKYKKVIPLCSQSFMLMELEIKRSINALRWWICVLWWYILFQNSFL